MANLVATPSQAVAVSPANSADLPYPQRMSEWPHRLPPLGTLVPFEAAARHRNFTAAARELHYSQATVSRRIAELEAALGVSLFRRRRHDVEPTPEAAVLLAAVQAAFGDLGQAADDLRRQAAEPTSITVFTDIALAATVVAPTLGDFHRDHPSTRVRVVSSFEPIEATSDPFDVGLGYERGLPTSLVVEPIAGDRLFPVCSPELFETLPTTMTPDDLVDHPLLHVDYDEPAWGGWSEFISALGGHASVPDGVVFTSYQVCLDVAEQGDGIALGWERTVQPRLDAGRLVRIEGLTEERPAAINAYRHPGEQSPAVDALVASIRDRLR